jgi:2,4-dichlorophenol 6-monooxygenase
VHWVTRLGGEVIGSLPFERQGDEMLAVTPTPLRNLSQHRLEPLLLAPDLDVRYGHHWKDAVEGADRVTVEVEGPEGRVRIEAAYLLGADGAASAVRRWTGVELEGPRTIQSFVMVHLAADLRALVGEAKGVLYFVVDPESSGTFVCHGLDHDWVYMIPWDADAEPVEAFTEARCRALVRAAMADADVPFEVVGTSTWHMSAQIADRYRVGRTFLVGDAAHRFPPTGGLGLNTGVADVHNLLWKLAAVGAGWADDGILDTFEAERRPVAQFNCDQSLANAFKLIEVPMALGLLDGDATTATMEAGLADPTTRAAGEAAIAAQAIHFDLLGLQLGHAYAGRLVIEDGSDPVVLAEPARDYEPSTRPGGRLPHVWIDATTSTLDLVDPRQPTLLVRAGATVDDPIDALVIVSCPPEVWASLGLGPDDALLVRPDQHVLFRGPCTEARVAWARVRAG